MNNLNQVIYSKYVICSWIGEKKQSLRRKSYFVQLQEKIVDIFFNLYTQWLFSQMTGFIENLKRITKIQYVIAYIYTLIYTHKIYTIFNVVIKL